MSADASFFHTWIQGHWVAIALEFDGDLSTDYIGVDATEDEHRDVMRQYRYAFAEDRFEAGRADVTISGAFEIDTSQSPTAIDFRHDEDDFVSILGILKFENDRLVMCLAPPGSRRPKFFQSPAGSQQMVFILERE